MPKSISVILPVYNQADHITAVTEGYRSALLRAGKPFEILLVTNACRDSSVEVCTELSKRFADVRTVNSELGGWGRAVKLGIQEATGDLICYTNSARTSEQDLTLLVLYAFVNPGNVIKANRKIRESARRRFGSLLYNLQCRALFDLSFWDINGTPKIFPRECSKLLELESDDDIIDAEFCAVCRAAGYQMLEVPIFSTKRHGGKSTTSYGSAARMYLGAMRLKRRLAGKVENPSSKLADGNAKDIVNF